MNQFKDVFLGRETRAYTRATTSQKCMRVSGKHNDLDNVGPSLRHHTFFEMLGNFSFGDYFKQRRDPVRVGAADRRCGTCRRPAVRRRSSRARPASRATTRRSRSGRRSCRRTASPSWALADNFWQMGDTGPCGRCSEIHYFRGNDLPCAEPGRACGPAMQLRSLRRGLEQRLHGVRPAGRRHAPSAAGAVDRHRAWASSASPRSSRASCRTTTRTCSRRSSTAIGDARRDDTTYRAATSTSRRTSRCASSPITCAR